MKKLLIFVLLVVVGVGAWLSRPRNAKNNYTHYLMNDRAQSKNDAEAKAEAFNYSDRYLWVELSTKADDKRVAVNVFHHWFDFAEIASALRAK